MRITRAPRHARFEILPVPLLRDSGLSFRARGIAVRLLSNVDGYSTTAQDLANESPREGRDAVLAAMRELESSGYLVRIRHRNRDGTFRSEAYISDTPQAGNCFANSGKPGPEEPAMAAPHSMQPKSVEPPSKASRPVASNTNTTTTTCEVGLSWPAQLDEAQAVVVRRVIEGLKHEEQQQLLDELAGALGSPKPPRQMASWLRALRMRMEAGEFMPDTGLAIIKERQRLITEEEDRRRKAAERKQEEERRNDPEFRARSEAARKEAIAAINEQLNLK